MSNIQAVLPYDVRISQNFPLEFTEISEGIGRYDETQYEVENIINLTDIKHGCKVLDIPCGFGRHSAFFYELGYEVTGIDISQEQISHANDAFPGPSYYASDMRKISSLEIGTFSLIVNLYSSFGYFPSVEEDRSCLVGFYDVLKNGGSLIMQLSDLERSIYNLGDKRLPYRRNKYEELDFDWDTQTLMVKYYNGTEVKSFVNMRIYSKEQLSDLLLSVGFNSVSFYGGLDGKVKNPSDRLVIYATK